MQSNHNQALSPLKNNFLHDGLLFYVVRKAVDRLSDAHAITKKSPERAFCTSKHSSP